MSRTDNPQYHDIPSLKMIDLNLLLVFDAIFRARSLTSAGLNLGLTQSATSHALSRLRETLSDRLFIRQGARMTPTPFAQMIAGDVRQALNILSSRLLKPRTFEPSESHDTFRIALRSAAELFLLAPLMAQLAAEAPNMRVLSMLVPRGEIEAELMRRKIDAALDVPMIVGSDIHQAQIWEGRIVAVARTDHPQLQTGLTSEDYLRLGHVIISTNNDTTNFEYIGLRKLNLQRRIVVSCSSILAAAAIVARTDLILTISEEHVAELLSTFNLVMHKMPFQTDGVKLSLYWHEDLNSDPANVWIRNCIINAVNKKIDI